MECLHCIITPGRPDWEKQRGEELRQAAVSAQGRGCVQGVRGVFPTVSSDGSKLTFVDNEFKAVWVADGRRVLRVVWEV